MEDARCPADGRPRNRPGGRPDDRPGRPDRPDRRVSRPVGALLAVLLLATLGPATAVERDRTVGPVAGGPPAATPSSDPDGRSGPQLPADIMGRVPTFDPPPPAVPVPAAGGPTARWLARIPTDQPVAFITIDDGWTRLPEAVALVKAARVPVTLFLTVNAVRDAPAYFKDFPGAGIQAHTVSHPKLKGRSYAFQRREVCASADQLGTLFGRRPTLFRAPFGEHDRTTLQVMHDCGLSAALFWKQTVNDGVVRYQEGATVQRGDIILMHFRPRFVDDFIAALQAIKAAGLIPARLEDYLPTAG